MTFINEILFLGHLTEPYCIFTGIRVYMYVLVEWFWIIHIECLYLYDSILLHHIHRDTYRIFIEDFE
jgi:hypothetical protein